MKPWGEAFSAIILAGGRSSRMGFPKAHIMLGGKSILEHILDVLKPLFEEVIIVGKGAGGLDEYPGVKVVEDMVKGCGPMGGIYTGLKVMSNEKGFFVACDMPNLRGDLIKRLLEISAGEDCECVLPCHSGGVEPLHAVYSKKILPRMEMALAEGVLSLRRFLNGCRCKYVPVGGEEVSSFANINTPEDLERARRDLESSTSGPLVVSIVGRPESGKTTLIVRLLPELKRRGIKVGVVKHCPHGFQLDRPGKDSWKFTQAGADGILLTSPERIGMIKRVEGITSIKPLLERYFHDFDLVLIEGLREAGIGKIEVLRKGISEGIESAPEDLIACVADVEVEAPCPVFKPEEIAEISALLEGMCGRDRG